MYAVFEDGSRHYKVSVGQTVKVDWRDTDIGGRVEFKRVLLLADGTDAIIRRHIGHLGVPVVYVNTIGAADNGKNVIPFDGESLVYDGAGQLITIGQQFVQKVHQIGDHILYASTGAIGPSQLIRQSLEKMASVKGHQKPQSSADLMAFVGDVVGQQVKKLFDPAASLVPLVGQQRAGRDLDVTVRQEPDERCPDQGDEDPGRVAPDPRPVEERRAEQTDFRDVRRDDFEEREVIGGERVAQRVDHLDHADVAGTDPQGDAQDGPGGNTGGLVDARVEAGVARGIVDQGRSVLLEDPARDTDVGGKADLGEDVRRLISAVRLARHGKEQPASVLVEQEDGATLGLQELAYAARREAEQRVQIGERRDGARNVVEQLQAIGAQAH